MNNVLLIIIVLFCQMTFSQTKTPNNLYKKAHQHITNGAYNKSINLLEKAIELDSLGNCGTGVNGIAQNELGYAYLRIQKYELSRQFFDKSISLNPKNPDPRMSKVTSYILEKNLTKAKIELDIFIEELPGYPFAYWQRGNILELEGKMKEALIDYRKTIVYNNLNILPKPIVEKINSKIKAIDSKNVNAVKRN